MASFIRHKCGERINTVVHHWHNMLYNLYFQQKLQASKSVTIPSSGLILRCCAWGFPLKPLNLKC